MNFSVIQVFTQGKLIPSGRVYPLLARLIPSGQTRPLKPGNKTLHILKLAECGLAMSPQDRQTGQGTDPSVHSSWVEVVVVVGEVGSNFCREQELLQLSRHRTVNLKCCDCHILQKASKDFSNFLKLKTWRKLRVLGRRSGSRAEEYLGPRQSSY